MIDSPVNMLVPEEFHERHIWLMTRFLNEDEQYPNFSRLIESETKVKEQ